jgi:hypothetical protein
MKHHPGGGVIPRSQVSPDRKFAALAGRRSGQHEMPKLGRRKSSPNGHAVMPLNWADRAARIVAGKIKES